MRPWVRRGKAESTPFRATRGFDGSHKMSNEEAAQAQFHALTAHAGMASDDLHWRIHFYLTADSRKGAKTRNGHFHPVNSVRVEARERPTKGKERSG